MVVSSKLAPARSGLLSGTRLVAAIFAIAALVSLCLEYGFEEPPLPIWLLLSVQVLSVAAYLAMVGVRFATAASLKTAVRRQAWDVILIVGAAVVLLGEAEYSGQRILKLGTIYVGTIQVLIVMRLLGGAVRWNLEMSQRRLHPARLLASSFLTVIIVGGCLLSLPKAMAPPHRAEQGHYATDRILNCFFTATSATCVTGLVVYDTGTDFTRFGQIVILVLIQLGGLGIMFFGSLFGVLVGKQLSLQQSLVLQDALSHRTVGQMGAIVRFIFATTFICETIGALLLYPMFAEHTQSVGDSIFFSIFHAISAFCNAGFALHDDSLIRYADHWAIYVSVMPLIVIGGLGFPVLHDLWGRVVTLLRPARVNYPEGSILMPQTRPVRRGRPLRLHSRLVLTTTLGLIVVGALLMFFVESVEWRSQVQREEGAALVSMIDMSPGRRMLAALFQSVTARTAGFNTTSIDLNAMSPAGHFTLMLLMFIGGSPASTAGGVKTAAFAVLIVGLRGALRGRDNFEAFGRTIPVEVLRRASVVVVIMAMLVSVVTLALSVTEAQPLREVMFEAVSACGTVGLSTGLTDQLTRAGRIIIMLAMFAGRLGPLTVLIALAGSRPAARFEYPPENVTIG